MVSSDDIGGGKGFFAELERIMDNVGELFGSSVEDMGGVKESLF